MSDVHPNDLIEFAQHRDTTLRDTYPPLPRKMGNPNAVAPEAVVATVLSRLPVALPQMPVTPPPAVPADPALDPYVAAGWM